MFGRNTGKPLKGPTMGAHAIQVKMTKFTPDLSSDFCSPSHVSTSTFFSFSKAQPLVVVLFDLL